MLSLCNLCAPPALCPVQREGGPLADEMASQPAAAAASQRGSLRVPLPPLALPHVEEAEQPPQEGASGRPLTARRLGALERQTSSVPEDSGGWAGRGIWRYRVSGTEQLAYSEGGRLPAACNDS